MQNKLLLYLIFLTVSAKAQPASELNSKSLTLPRLTTLQQNTLPPQQAGNVVFNLDQGKLAVHDGISWNLISALPPAYSNIYSQHKVFMVGGSFLVPAGTTRIMAELWGSGGDGEVLESVGATFSASGGGGGEYVQTILEVNPNETLTIEIARNTPTLIKRNGNTLTFAASSEGPEGGFYFSTYGRENIILLVAGESGDNADFSFQEAVSGTFRKIVKGGKGGGTYPYFRNGGKSCTIEFDVNTGSYIGSSTFLNTQQSGQFPGGGGAAGYGVNSGTGSFGAVVLHY